MASTKNGIIYPDNYDKVADVPTDMKVLAESVDENIERINKNLDKNADELKNLQKDNTGNKTAIEAINKKNTEQDTNIQKNVKDIEANQNNIKALQVENTEVKAENERLRSDIESISLVGEAEGESIDLEDSAGARFKKFGIGGNHSQVTRKGIQLLNIKDVADTTVNGITYSIKNGKITLNGTSTAKVDILLYASVEGLDKSQSYAFNAIASNLNNLYFNTYRGGRWTDIIQQHSGSNKNGWVSTGYDSYYFDMNIIAGATFNNFVVTPMFCKGTTIPSNYEQYGATPSLDFPSKIKAVKDNVNVVVCNKNILKILGLGERWEYTEKGIKNLYANPGIKISQLNLKKGQTVEIGFLLLSKVNNDISFVNFVNDKTGVIASFANIQNYNVNTIYKKKYTATDDCTIKTVLYGNVNEEIFEFQLWAEYNQISNTYIKHQEQTITMPIQQEMLKEDYFNWVNEKEVHKWNLLSFTGNEAWSLLSGATSVFLLGNVSGQTYGGHDFSMCTHFKYDTRVGGMANLQDETFAMQYEYSALYVKCNKFTTVEEWKAYLKSQYENGTPIKLAYITANITELSFTDEQKVVAKKIKETLHTYKNITHIYSTDETNPVLDVEYAKDLNTQNNNLQNQIDEIKQLISTTQTSAMLLDNLQKEVESEVE